MRKNIIVVGSGVIGLSTAITLSRQHNVRVIAENFGPATDSVKATAIWHVYLVPETAEVLNWSAITLSRLIEIARTFPTSGVEIVRGVELFRTQPRRVPSWAHIPQEFAFLTDDEIDQFNRPENQQANSSAVLANCPVRWGYRLKAPAAKMESYLAWLLQEAESRKITFERASIGSLAELAGDCDVVVNCTGLGAAKLVKNEAFEPYKGQYFVATADADAPIDYVGDDDHPGGMAYVIPRAGEVMIGGTAEAGRSDLEQTIEWLDVAARAGSYVPWVRRIASQESLRPVVGVRPVRPAGIRIEKELTEDGRTVIHNYGHGGSGFSLSWGCAEAIGALVS